MGAVFRILRPLVNRALPDQPIAVRVLRGPARGLRLMIDPRSEKYYWRGGHEPAVAKTMMALLKPGDVFWDVGAHIGYFTLLGGRLVGPKGRVHAFEPLPANVERLRQAISLNHTQNVEIHPTAVSDHQGDAFLSAAESSLMWSLGDAGFQVPCTTLDAVLAKADPPTLIKIDVEGAELRVLAGAGRLLQALPGLILELLTGASVAAAQTLLTDWRFTRLDRRNWLVRHP